MIYVYTCILNGFDNLRPPDLPVNAKFLCFTDNLNAPEVKPWEFVKLDTTGMESISRASRLPKILSHKYLPSDAEISIYHDGNFKLKKDPEELANHLLHNYDWAAHQHPARNCIYREAEIILRDCPNTNAIDVELQISRYRTQGIPENAGLWANGFIVRRHNEVTSGFNERWWKEFDTGCDRDQLSLPPVRHELGFKINTLPGNIYESPHIAFYWHVWTEKQMASRRRP